VKVVLGELKKKPKVVLAAAKAKAPVQTRKNKAARKVRVSMVSLSRKIHRATDIRKKASEDKIEEIKKALQKAELIKADSKAPEIMLRQMYADFMMLKKRAL
jgi:anti-sigma28 factor (negative regulator of flagellin synthesis)